MNKSIKFRQTIKHIKKSDIINSDKIESGRHPVDVVKSDSQVQREVAQNVSNWVVDYKREKTESIRQARIAFFGSLQGV